MSRKGENIYKRKDGRWEGRFIKSRLPNGKPKYGYIYARTYREAKEKLISASALKQVEQYVDPVDKPSDLFQNIAEEWLSYMKPQIKESSYNKYKNLLDSYILPSFGLQRLDLMTHNVLENYCNWLLLYGGKKKSGLSPKTVSDITSIIRSILRFALQAGKHVPYDGCFIKIKQKPNEMCVLSRSEQQKLCQYLKSNLDAANIGILLCLFTGLRVGEICALQWEDINFAEKTIHVHQTMQRVQRADETGKRTCVIVTPPKSVCSIRTIPIPNALLEVLQQHKKCSRGFFLTNSLQVYMEPRTMQNRFKKALELAAVAPVNYHCLRHTFATRCIELGFDVKSLSEILGHSTVNITMNRYVHPSMELKNENMQRLSELFSVK